MYSFEVVNNSLLDFFHEVLLAPSKCLFKWINVDYPKKRPRDFKNSFYFVILQVSSMPGVHQYTWFVFWSFRLISKQCKTPQTLKRKGNRTYYILTYLSRYLPDEYWKEKKNNFSKYLLNKNTNKRWDNYWFYC